jgi:hypothetical protein
MPRFWLPRFQQTSSSPRVPRPSFPGRVLEWAGKRACGPRTSGCSNVRMKGSPCPEALASPEPERVGLKVGANPHQSRLSSLVEAGWKRGRTAQNPPCLSRGSFQDRTGANLWGRRHRRPQHPGDDSKPETVACRGRCRDGATVAVPQDQSGQRRGRSLHRLALVSFAASAVRAVGMSKSVCRSNTAPISAWPVGW